MLANTAEMPRSGDLPLPLKLAGATRSRSAPRVLRPIANELKDVLPLAEAEPTTKSQTKREAKAERKRREAEEDARAARVPAVAHDRPGAYLGGNPQGRGTFTGRTTNRYVRRKLQALPWADAATRTCIEAPHKFEKESLRMAVWISSRIFRYVE
jgi:hypothetical protein